MKSKVVKTVPVAHSKGVTLNPPLGIHTPQMFTHRQQLAIGQRLRDAMGPPLCEQWEVAKELGVTQQAIDQGERIALAKLALRLCNTISREEEPFPEGMAAILAEVKATVKPHYNKKKNAKTTVA